MRYRDSHGRQRTKGGFRRRRDADEWATALESGRSQGTLVVHSDGAARLGRVGDAWRQSIEGRRKPKTVDGYEKLFEGHVRPALGHRAIGSITYSDVDGFVRSLEEGRRPGTVRNTFFVLKMVLDYGVRCGLIRHNPCAGVELPTARSPEMLFLTAAEVRVLARAVDDRWDAARRRQRVRQPFGLLVEFAAFTGLRAGEIAALRVGSVDLRDGAVSVVRSGSTVRGQWIEGEPKTKAGRRIVLVNRALLERIRDHVEHRLLDRDGYVFAGPNGGPLKYGSFYSLHFKPAVEAVLPERLHGLRFHDLRHTYASLLVEQGAHPKEIAELMGHSSVQITLDRYGHVMPHLRTTLAERLDASYRAAAPPAIAAPPIASVAELA
ncbi:MAG: site-specific integrase [Acidimicrobiia bacterium]|nr:site-specific integrase [Acidimicrobiia bacterium]